MGQGIRIAGIAVRTLPRSIRACAGVCSTLLLVALAACSDNSSGPSGANWWEGTWRAVRANNQPLPYRSDRVTIRDVVATLYADTTHASTFYVAGSITTLSGSTSDNTSTRTVKVTPSGETVGIYAGPTSTIGQLQLTFTRKGDTLVIPNYSGAEFKLVRR